MILCMPLLSMCSSLLFSPCLQTTTRGCCGLYSTSQSPTTLQFSFYSRLKILFFSAKQSALKSQILICFRLWATISLPAVSLSYSLSLSIIHKYELSLQGLEDTLIWCILFGWVWKTQGNSVQQLL